MNKSFTKNKELVLSNEFKIIPDSDSGVILVFLTTKENKKKEILPFEEKYYFTRISQALRKYVDLSLNIYNDDLFLMVKKAESIYKLIDNIDKEFKQF